MDIMNPPVSFNLWLSGRSIRVYSVSPIFSGNFHPDMLAESLRLSRPLSYPYTWYVYGEQAAIVNIIDLQQAYEQQQSSPSYSTYYQPQQQQQQQQQEAIDESDGYENETHSYEYLDEVAILQHLNMNQINESFQQASDQLVACSGLTKKFISDNLTVTKYHHEEEEEENEICVVCQVEFEKNERVGMLECRHRFHTKCIKEWLLRKNVCPLCKAQALKV